MGCFGIYSTKTNNQRNIFRKKLKNKKSIHDIYISS